MDRATWITTSEEVARSDAAARLGALDFRAVLGSTRIPTPCGEEGEEDRGDDSADCREQKYAPVDGEAGARRQFDRVGRAEPLNEEARERQAGDGSQEAQHEGLSQRLEDDAAGGCADGDAHGEFATAGGRSSEQETAHVERGREEDQGRRGEEQPQTLAKIAAGKPSEVRLQVENVGSEGAHDFEVGGHLRQYTGLDCIQFGFGCGSGHARPEQTKHAGHTVPRLLRKFARGSNETPRIRDYWIEGECFRHDAGDHAGSMMEREAPAHNVSGSAQFAGPEVVSEDDSAAALRDPAGRMCGRVVRTRQAWKRSRRWRGW